MAVAKRVIQINNDIRNALTPSGLEFSRTKIFLGENYAKIYAISKYPNTLPQGWAATITNLASVVTCQLFEPCDNGILIMDLSKSVARYHGIADSTRDALERQRAEKSADAAEKLMRRIDNGEVVGYMSNIIMISARDEATLEKSCRSFESTISALNCKSRLLVNQQDMAFKAVSPCNTPSEELLRTSRRNVPISTYIEGFPFASNSFSDKDGYPLGRNTKNGLVVVNPWERGGDRTNSNIIVLGVAGVGKSATIKHLMISEFMIGTINIVIDPESEYAELTSALGGDLINAGGGSFIINPLQFKNVPLDEESEITSLYKDTDGKGMSAMALHFKSLEVFFKLYHPDLNNMQLSLLKRMLETLYNAFNIFWDTDIKNLKPSDYPILSDLYELIVQVRKEGIKSDEPSYKENIFALEIILRELSKGADSFIWNGHTTVEPKSNFICLDTNDLQDTSDNVKKAQYYNLLTWAWERMSRDRKEKVMLYCDEAYLLVDPHVPQSLIYLRNIAKRARKYTAGLCVISHSVVDFLDPAVKLYGQALLDIPTYKFIMGTDGKNLQELTDLYNLTEIEQEIIANKKRGVSVFFVGSNRFVLSTEISSYELALMGSGGGK